MGSNPANTQAPENSKSWGRKKFPINTWQSRDTEWKSESISDQESNQATNGLTREGCWDAFRDVVNAKKVPKLWPYGSFSPGRGKWAKSVLFSFFWSFTVTKRFDFFKFSQLFWRDYVRCSLKILSFTLQNFFGVPCSTPVLALLSHFYVKIRAPVRPNLQRWTGFDLLIISGVSLISCITGSDTPGALGLVHSVYCCHFSPFCTSFKAEFAQFIQV